MHQVSLNNNCKGECDHTILAAIGVPQVYTLSSSHIYCIKLFNAPDWDWANQAAVLVYVYWVLSFFIHCIKDWQIMEAVWHIMRELLYFWKIHVWWSSFDSWATLIPGECRDANACTDACMYIYMLVNACACASLFAWMHVCMFAWQMICSETLHWPKHAHL